MSKESLSVTTSSLPKSRIAIELEIPSESCKTCLNETINSISRSVKIPGFRAGKIPKQVLIQRIGLQQLYASALEKLIDKSYSEALKIKSIEPLCEPELVDGFEELIKKFNPDENLKVVLETDIEPEAKLKKTKDLKIQIKKNIFDTKSIDQALEKSRAQLANIIPVNDRAAQIGDIAVVSFEGIYKDSQKPIEGGSSEGMDLELEQNKMIPGFVEGIVGMKINDKKTLSLTFPDDYAQEDARGKEAIFKVILKDLKTKELPELDDEFAKQSSNKSSLKELKKDIEEQLKKNFENNQKNIRAESLVDAFVKELKVEIPKSMIDIEVRKNIEQTAQRFAQQGLDVKSTFTPELIKSLAESTRPQAEKDVMRNLALKALARQEKITIQEIDIDKKMEDYEEEIKKSQNKIDISKLRSAIKNDLLKEKLIKWIEDNCQIEEVIEKTKNTKNKNNAKPKTSSKAKLKTNKKTTKSKDEKK